MPVPFRDKIRPARRLQRPFREKTRPASTKTSNLGCFEHAGRTFSRFRDDTPQQGELFRTHMKPPPRKPGRKGDSGFNPATHCTKKASNAPVRAPLQRRAPSISHAIPTQPDPTPTQNPQNSNDQTSNHETHPRELHAKLLGRQGQLPRNFARNSIGRSFNKL